MVEVVVLFLECPELKGIIMKIRIIIAAALSAAVLLVGGVAFASIPGSSGVIHGCYSVKLGILRVIDTDAGQTCAKGEIGLNWNQTGLQGPAGQQGPAGISGYLIDSDGGVNKMPIQNPADGNWYVQGDITCPAGKFPLGGGGELRYAPGGMVTAEPGTLVFSREAGSSGWEILFRIASADSTTQFTIVTEVQCATVAS
jgi:hypothetical protein